MDEHREIALMKTAVRTRTVCLKPVTNENVPSNRQGPSGHAQSLSPVEDGCAARSDFSSSGICLACQHCARHPPPYLQGNSKNHLRYRQVILSHSRLLSSVQRQLLDCESRKLKLYIYGRKLRFISQKPLFYPQRSEQENRRRPSVRS